MLQTFRLLILGSPGSGKTHFMRRLMQRSPFGGVIVDPLDEYADAPERYVRFEDFWSGEIGQLVDTVTDEGMEIPSLLFIDEIHRFISPSDTIRSSKTLRLLDIARNLGIHWTLATKQATLLPPLITTLASHVAINPPRTPAVRRWLASAGIEIDENVELPEYHWILAPVGGTPEIVSSDRLLEIAEESLAFGKAPA